MPLAFGAVHRQYAAGDDAAAELAAFIAAAHEHDIEVWLDVVFNHTTEVDATGPTYSLRGLSDGAYYRLRDDGSYIETTGCGNDIDAASPAAQDLVVWSLDRLADLGVDGFRFDLAAGARRVTTRSSPASTRGRASRGVAMVAEPWDAVGTHQLGRAWPGRRLDAVERPLPRGRPRLPARRGRADRRARRSACRAAPTSSTRRWTASTS